MNHALEIARGMAGQSFDKVLMAILTEGEDTALEEPVVKDYLMAHWQEEIPQAIVNIDELPNCHVDDVYAQEWRWGLTVDTTTFIPIFRVYQYQRGSWFKWSEGIVDCDINIPPSVCAIEFQLFVREHAQDLREGWPCGHLQPAVDNLKQWVGLAEWMGDVDDQEAAFTLLNEGPFEYVVKFWHCESINDLVVLDCTPDSLRAYCHQLIENLTEEAICAEDDDDFANAEGIRSLATDLEAWIQ